MVFRYIFSTNWYSVKFKVHFTLILWTLSTYSRRGSGGKGGICGHSWMVLGISPIFFHIRGVCVCMCVLGLGGQFWGVILIVFVFCQEGILINTFHTKCLYNSIIFILIYTLLQPSLTIRMCNLCMYFLICSLGMNVSVSNDQTFKLPPLCCTALASPLAVIQLSLSFPTYSYQECPQTSELLPLCSMAIANPLKSIQHSWTFSTYSYGECSQQG